MEELKPLLDKVAKEHGIDAGHIQYPIKDSDVRARYEFCWRAATETKSSIRDVAKICNYRDAAGVSYAIARYAESIGRPERTFSEAREGFKTDTIEWRVLAKLAQDVLDKHRITKAEISRRSGRSRRVWANVLTGKSISADDLLAVLYFLGLNTSDILTKKAKARERLNTEALLS